MCRISYYQDGLLVEDEFPTATNVIVEDYAIEDDGFDVIRKAADQAEFLALHEDWLLANELDADDVLLAA